MKMRNKDIQQQLAEFVQMLEIFSNTFQPTSVQISSRIKVCLMHWLFKFFSVGVTSGP